MVGEIRIELKPLSINDAYKGRRFKTPEYSKYAKKLTHLLPSKIDIPEKSPYQIFFEFGFSSSASDWDNCIKTTQDVIATKYGFNDKLIRKGTVTTEIVKKGEEYIKFKIESL